MPTSSRRPSLALAVKIHRIFLQFFPPEFRSEVGEEVHRAFEGGCRRAMDRRGLPGLLGYAGRGCVDAVKEGLAERKEARRSRGSRGLESRGSTLDLLLQDVRFAVRSLRRRPVFAGVALLTLALGIGSATAIFSVVNGVLLKPLPYPDAEELVVLWSTNPERGMDEFRMAAPEVFELQRSSSAFTGTVLAAGATANLTGDDLPPVRVEGGLVSADFFEVLGVQPLLGRTFRMEENQGDHRVVILSHSLWSGRFGGDPEIVGKHASMDGISMQIVGVMPPIPLPIGGSTLELPGPEAPLFWRPLDYTLDWVADIGAHVMSVVARLGPGVTLAQAQSEVSAVAAALVAEDRTNRG